MERVRQELPSAEMKFVENGKHSPHSEEAAYEESNQIAREYLQAIG
jgi:pimeloyl-ACP methyl ester carboxylesterase